MTRKLRFGVIGCAGIAVRSVIPGNQQSETCEVVAIASRGISKAQETAAKLKFRRPMEAMKKFARFDIDAIYIPLPNYLHMEWAIRAIEAGKHVLCEKPIALNEGEAQRMVDAAAKRAFIWLKRTCTGIIRATSGSERSLGLVKSENSAVFIVPLRLTMRAINLTCVIAKSGRRFDL